MKRGKVKALRAGGEWVFSFRKVLDKARWYLLDSV